MSNERKFELGNLVATKSINDKMHCDWGDLCDMGKNVSFILGVFAGVIVGFSLAKKYYGKVYNTEKWGAKEKIWIITEWDRSTTTILFPEEY